MNWEDYDKKFYTQPELIEKTENDRLVEILRNQSLDGKRCLDFGCGSGHWTSIMLEMGAIVTGVDSSAEIICKCREKIPNCTFLKLSEDILPFDDLYFDVVLVSWVFQEIVNNSQFEKCIMEITRVLRLGGELIITDNIYNEKRVKKQSTILGDLFGNKGDSGLLRLFPNNTLLEIIDEYGLKRKLHLLGGHSFFEKYQS